jgi:hypothetical protein
MIDAEVASEVRQRLNLPGEARKHVYFSGLCHLMPVEAGETHDSDGRRRRKGDKDGDGTSVF